MTRPADPAADRPVPASAGAMRMTRGVTATWWYTLTGVLFLELAVVLISGATMVEEGRSAPVALTVLLGGMVWWASTLLLLWDYRDRGDGAMWSRWPRVLLPLAIAAVVAVVTGLLSGVWLIGAFPIVQTVVLLNWPPGVRARVVIAATAVLVALFFVDARVTFPRVTEASWPLLGFFCACLPAMSVLTLWWWDVLIAVDRARVSEARLAAAQERLRVATDVHDLQGHHLQVIALQLELAERLMPDDQDAGMAELRAARRSVDEARQGTRDLALRFRSVPLRDELANAADLLQAAGISVEAKVDDHADEAPASVLGPVIRETTTNVLRHGGGRWARLTLLREGAQWRYEIANDASGEAGGMARSDANAAPSKGAGLEGIGRRVSDGGGTVDVRRSAQEFAVVVHLPTGAEAER